MVKFFQIFVLIFLLFSKKMRKEKTVEAVGYTRISTSELKQKHSLDYQKSQIKTYSKLINVRLKKIEVERASGRNLNKRPKLQKLLADKKFDILICTKIDRLARNIIELNKIVNDLQAVGKDVVFIENQIDTSTANGRLFLNILGSFAEFEGAIISERTKEGLRMARNK